MTYQHELSEVLKKKLRKIQKRDKILYEAVLGKIKEILVSPQHYKPLRGDLKGERRVHVKSSFVLVFEVFESENLVKFYDLNHHDNIYKKPHFLLQLFS